MSPTPVVKLPSAPSRSSDVKLALQPRRTLSPRGTISIARFVSLPMSVKGFPAVRVMVASTPGRSATIPTAGGVTIGTTDTVAVESVTAVGKVGRGTADGRTGRGRTGPNCGLRFSSSISADAGYQ